MLNQMPPHGAGQADRPAAPAPQVDTQTAKQDGPSRSRDRPTTRKIHQKETSL